MLILDLKGGGSIKRLLIITFTIVLDFLIAFQSFAYAEIITENEIFVTLYESKKVPYLIPQSDVKIIWAVKDSEIASISSKGIVKGLSVGKTEITATAGEMSGSCTLYVKEPLPNLEISYTGNTIFGCEPLSEYNINDKTYISDTDGKIPIQNEWLGRTIQISKKNVVEKCCSDSISLFIEHNHDFSILSTVEPTCLLAGYTIYKCICGETMNSDSVPATGHKLSDFYCDGNYHFQKCMNECCNHIEKSLHYFDNFCDTTCNICGFEREIEHQFDSPCDIECNICGFTRAIYHQFDNSCDDTCNICKFKRDVFHKFVMDCDTECSICGFRRTANHKFDNECDETCNICGYTRKIEHKYENPCDEICDICGHAREVKHSISKSYLTDDNYHFLECKLCGKVFEKAEHIFDNSCDETCNICKFRRNISHNLSELYSYNRRSHYKVCLVCQKIFNKETHIYDDNYDTTCNVCGFVRKAKEKSNSKNSLKSAKENNENTDENPDNSSRINLNEIRRKLGANYALAFSATGAAIVSMVLLILLKEHKNPRV